MPTQTLTLQVIFDPTNPLCTTFGRFVNDTPGGTIAQRSKVWIQNIETNPVVLPGNTVSVQVVGSNPNTPQIQIYVIGILPQQWQWAKGVGGFTVSVFAVFGRARHGDVRQQTFGSPFSQHNANSTNVATIFEGTFGTTASPMPSTNLCILPIGVARFHSAPPPTLTSISGPFYDQQPNSFTITGTNLTGATLQWSPGGNSSEVTVTATQITGYAQFPDSASSGSVCVVVEGQTSNTLNFGIQPSPNMDDVQDSPTGSAKNSTLGADVYEFNVGVKAHFINPQGQAVELHLGHDPDMDVEP